MALWIASLNSGSNGNCYYVANGEDAVLIDAGISCRELLRRMDQCGLDMTRVRAVFISHEHSDHIRGLEVLIRKYALPVYVSGLTLRGSGLLLPPGLCHSISDGHVVQVGSLQIIPFSKYHDAADPYSFTISSSCGTCVGVFTDLGRVCDKLRYYFSLCHAAFLEANYDPAMLAAGNYPYMLKKRISGGHGHLSNDQALELFLSGRSAHLQRLVLSHLSRDNNDPELVQQLFEAHRGHTDIAVASRYAASPVYEVRTNGVPVTAAQPRVPAGQLRLFI